MPIHSNIQTGIGIAGLATLDTEQFIFYSKTALVDMITSLGGSDVEVMLVSAVHELHAKIHDILDNAVSKLVGNTSSILANLFNSTSELPHEVWTLQFPFLYNCKDNLSL